MIYLGQYIIVTKSGLKWHCNIVLARYCNTIHSILYELQFMNMCVTTARRNTPAEHSESSDFCHTVCLRLSYKSYNKKTIIS